MSIESTPRTVAASPQVKWLIRGAVLLVVLLAAFFILRWILTPLPPLPPPPPNPPLVEMGKFEGEWIGKIVHDYHVRGIVTRLGGGAGKVIVHVRIEQSVPGTPWDRSVDVDMPLGRDGLFDVTVTGPIYYRWSNPSVNCWIVK